MSNNKASGPFILDKAELLIHTRQAGKRWRSYDSLPNKTLIENYATKAILRLTVGARCYDGPASSQLFVKPSDIDARLGTPELLVARAIGVSTLAHSNSMTIVNLDTESSFDYGFIASLSTSPVFAIHLVGYYTETTTD